MKVLKLTSTSSSPPIAAEVSPFTVAILLHVKASSVAKATPVSFLITKASTVSLFTAKPSGAIVKRLIFHVVGTATDLCIPIFLPVYGAKTATTTTSAAEPSTVIKTTTAITSVTITSEIVAVPTTSTIRQTRGWTTVTVIAPTSEKQNRQKT
jgi:hypothetical protein